MASIANGLLVCDACGRKYPLRPELAGKKVRCKCGEVMAVPASVSVGTDQPVAVATAASSASSTASSTARQASAPMAMAGGSGTVSAPFTTTTSRPTAPVAPEATSRAEAPDDLYDLAPDVGTPRKPIGPVVRAPALARPGTATAAVAPKALAYQRPQPVSKERAEAEAENALGGPPWRELYVPIGLIAAGLLWHVGRGAVGADDPLAAVARTLPRVGVELLINLGLSFVAMLLVAKLFEVSFGSPGPAVLKLVAICLVPAGLAGAIGAVVGHDSAFVAMMVGTILFFPLCHLCFWLLFDMDFQDAFYCETALWLVNQWALMFLMALLFSNGA